MSPKKNLVGSLMYLVILVVQILSQASEETGRIRKWDGKEERLPCQLPQTLPLALSSGTGSDAGDPL